jgi:hypothetical protein
MPAAAKAVRRTRALLLWFVLGLVACAPPDEWKVGGGVESGSVEQSLAIPPGNLTANPSFEADTSAWSGWQATLSRVADAAAPNGGYVVKVTRTTGTMFSVDEVGATVASATINGNYYASAWVRCVAGSSSCNKPVTLNIREGGTQTSASIEKLLTPSYQYIQVSHRAATAGTLEVYLLQANAAAGDYFLADLITLSMPQGVAVPLPNLTTNPSFEADLGGWGSWQASLTRVADATAPNGAHAVKVARNTGISFSIENGSPVVPAATVNATYHASAWVRCVEGSSSCNKPVTIYLREGGSQTTASDPQLLRTPLSVHRGLPHRDHDRSHGNVSGAALFRRRAFLCHAYLTECRWGVLRPVVEHKRGSPSAYCAS